MKLGPAVNMLMAVSLFILMGYSLTSSALHEWTGVFVFCLIGIHQYINRGWWLRIFQGRYTKFRMIQVLLTLLFLLSAVALAWSGFVMSRHVFSFLPSRGSGTTAQIVHLSAAFWFFILSGVHLGFNRPAVDRMIRFFKRKGFSLPGKAGEIIYKGLAVYGGYVFYKRHVFDYLFMETHFMISGGRENPFFFLFD